MIKQRKKPIKDYSRMAIAQLKRLKNELDTKESIQRLNKIHDENIQRQINNNLTNEYTRIRNYLLNTMPVGTRDNHHLKKREKEIEKMKIF